jgi:hypothetical protein
MWAALALAARRLAALDAPRAPRVGEIDLRPVRAAFAGAPDDVTAARILRVVDDLTTGIHHGVAAALPAHLQYVRIAGSNISPLCLPPGELAYDGPRFHSAELTAEHGTVPAGQKLAGASLGNFSAFISERWRANDWMWGRLDAAKSIVDVTTTKGRLASHHAEVLDHIERIVTRPFALGDGAPPGWSAELDAAAAGLWRRHRDAVADELRDERDRSEAERLCTTKRLLVLRRQWEVLAEELPGVLAASLRPQRAAGARRADAPASTMDATLAAYESSPRSFGDVWGMRWSTALGIRAAYATWSATRPRARLWRWLRTPLKPMPISLLGTVLARNRGLFALALAFNAVLLPRLRGLVAWLVLAIGAGVAVLMLRVYRRRPRWRPERFDRLYVGGTIVTFAAGVAFAQSPRLHNRVFGLPVDAALTHFDRHLLNPYTWLATGAALVASWLLLCWARLAWRAAIAVVCAGIMAFWAMFSRMKPAPDAGKWLRLGFAFRPILWALVVAVVMTTSLAHLAFRRGWRIAEYSKD